MRGAVNSRAIAVERSPQRCQMIAENSAALGAPGLEIVEGEVGAADLDGLPAPDAIFIGGAISQPGTIDRAWHYLKFGGILVANAVTLEGQSAMMAAQQTIGGELVRIDIAVSRPIGPMSALEPRMSVLQWRATKQAVTP